MMKPPKTKATASPDVVPDEQMARLIARMYRTQIQQWRKRHGDRVPPPIYIQNGKPIWLTRKQRRTIIAQSRRQSAPQLKETADVERVPSQPTDPVAAE